jgi:squalene-associated FAD-dependent desaturase
VLRRSAWLPAPLHLGGALLRYGQLSVGERLRAALAARALGALDPADPELDRRTLGSWLSEHGQSPRAIAALWDLIALPSLNLPADEASLALGAFVFRTGLLASADAGDMGFHMRPLSEIVGDPALAELRRVGVEVRLSWRARGVEHASEGLRVRGESSQLDSSQLDADAVIVAVPHQRAGDLIESLAPEAAAGARALGSSPIVNVHVVYDRRVCELAFVGGVDTPVQYVFDRTAVAGLRDGSQYLTISLSGAEAEMGLGAETLRARYLDALAELFPRARVAHVARFFLTREHAATFRAAPGVAALRPAARTETLRLALAGAYTDTGWPGTLEGAVLSGHAAAREALQGS